MPLPSTCYGNEVSAGPDSVQRTRPICMYIVQYNQQRQPISEVRTNNRKRAIRREKRAQCSMKSVQPNRRDGSRYSAPACLYVSSQVNIGVGGGAGAGSSPRDTSPRRWSGGIRNGSGHCFCGEMIAALTRPHTGTNRTASQPTKKHQTE